MTSFRSQYKRSLAIINMRSLLDQHQYKKLFTLVDTRLSLDRSSIKRSHMVEIKFYTSVGTRLLRDRSSTSANSIFDDRSRKERSLIFAIFADNSSSQLKSSATVIHSLILTNEQRSLRSLIQDTKDFIDFIKYFEFCEDFEHLETTVLIVTNDFLFIVTLLMIVIRMLLKTRFHLFVLLFQFIETHLL
jgi:hypothetical protein